MKIDIKNLNVGDSVRGHLAVASAVVKQAKNGAYVEMVLTDGETNIVGKRWQSEVVPPVGTICEVMGLVEQFNNVPNINLKRVIPTDLPIDDYVRLGYLSSRVLAENIEIALQLIEDDELATLASHIISNMPEFYTSPGAYSVHHAFKGGLAQHTVEVVATAQQMAEALNRVGNYHLNMDLIIAGALLHDIGKATGYFMNGLAPEMSEWGKQVEHHVLGCHIVMTAAEEVEGGIDEEKLRRLCHCIAAHHGNLEWG